MLVDSSRAARSIVAVGLALLVVLAYAVGRATAGRTPATAAPGPARIVDGTGIGFAHNEAGAEAAAAHYLVELERAMDTLSADRTSRVAARIATPAEAQAVTEHAASVIALERSDGPPLRRVAIATNLLSYSSVAAQVTVLESWLYATTREEAVWGIERVSLAWQNDDWRIAAIAGAAPSTNESLAELRAQLQYPGPGDASVR